MKFCTFASSSSGNCSFLTEGETKILIDAGISMRRIKTSLTALDYSIDGLDGIFITHDHSDHISALKMLLKYYDIPIFATWDTYLGIIRHYPEATGRVSILKPGEAMNLGEMEILPFSTPHDAPGSVGYKISAKGRSFALVTDIGFCSTNVLNAVQGANTVVLEANHDVAMLMNGPYPYYLRERILSKYGHLSNCDSGHFAAALAESGTKRIILAHLSEKNNTPELAECEVSKALTGMDVELLVAPAKEMGEVYII